MTRRTILMMSLLAVLSVGLPVDAATAVCSSTVDVGATTDSCKLPARWMSNITADPQWDPGFTGVIKARACTPRCTTIISCEVIAGAPVPGCPTPTVFLGYSKTTLRGDVSKAAGGRIPPVGSWRIAFTYR